MCIWKYKWVRCDECGTAMDIPQPEFVRCLDVVMEKKRQSDCVPTNVNEEVHFLELCQPCKDAQVDETGGFNYTVDPRYGKDRKMEK